MNPHNILLYFPKWIFEKNLGDSVIFTFVPKLLKKVYPEAKIHVVTYGFVSELMRLDENVDSVRGPTQEEIYYDYRAYAFSKDKNPNIKVIYPDWHPNTFSFWKNNHDFLVNHPTANIITVNYLLQLGLEDLVFSEHDFLPYANISTETNKTDNINVGIVPTTKLSGKTTPHPFCDGLGMRFNGMKGVESWREFVSVLKTNPKIKVFEFSKENFGLGDAHFTDTGDFFQLVKDVSLMDYGVLSDGGLHHVFNILKKPITIFQACLINKAEFFKLGNANFPEHLHLECRKNCPSYYHQIFGGEDKSLTCKRECESLSPKLLAEYTLSKIPS